MTTEISIFIQYDSTQFSIIIDKLTKPSSLVRELCLKHFNLKEHANYALYLGDNPINDLEILSSGQLVSLMLNPSAKGRVVAQILSVSPSKEALVDLFKYLPFTEFYVCAFDNYRPNF